jgi:hypothetical protein
MTDNEQEKNVGRDELADDAPRTDPRDDEDEGADEQPQPWAKLSSGDADNA